ncbi:MAG TPA: DegV family protein [Wenzhouxiangella sp.]
MSKAEVITHIDAPRLRNAVLAGIANVLKHRDHINKINVFPVPDGDTGTNLAFTLSEIRTALAQTPKNLPELLDRMANAALDGARGNSGAIMAQYFQGLSESSRDYQVLDARRLAKVSKAAAESAWGAMTDPVPGTLPTVLEDFADELTTRANDGVEDLRELMAQGLKRAKKSLADTPKKLAALRDAGVVDAGGQGFVDFLEGIWQFTRSGKVPDQPQPDTSRASAQPMPTHGEAPETHRFCTECLIDGTDMDITQLRADLEALDASSLVVAGSVKRARVHIHTDSPGDVFRICGQFGDLRQQKADDMTKQHALMNQQGQVAIVTDSAADLPGEEIDRLGIHVVPVRLNFGDEEFLDKLTITPSEFYARVAESTLKPQTSQPPPSAFTRQFELLTSHGLQVLAMQVSGKLSGTLQAAKTAARHDEEHIEVFDTESAACGQALMVLFAAEAAAKGWETTAIVSTLKEIKNQIQTFALVRDLSWGVRGGRVKPWMETVSKRLGIHLILTTKDGVLKPCSVVRAGPHALKRYARFLLKRMRQDKTYRVIISHNNAEKDAKQLRDVLLTQHPNVDACWVEQASPAVGAHAGPGCLVVGLQVWTPPESRG